MMEKASPLLVPAAAAHASGAGPSPAADRDREQPAAADLEEISIPWKT